MGIGILCPAISSEVPGSRSNRLTSESAMTAENKLPIISLNSFLALGVKYLSTLNAFAGLIILENLALFSCFPYVLP